MMRYPWLMPTLHKITQAFLQGFGHHALLFRAETGLGVETLIRQLSAFLLCQETLKPCGHCHACRLFYACNHRDFYHIAPIDGKDIGVDQVRAVSENLYQHAGLGGNKVVYIEGVERLTEQASNALLKTLEEPASDTYFLLQADISQPILPTIYSRCQPWIVTTPTRDISIQWLQTTLSHAPNYDDLSLALRVNGDRPLQARDFILQNQQEKRLHLLRQFWLFYRRCSPLEILPLFDKDQPYQQLDWIEAFLIDGVKYKLGIEYAWQCEDIAKGVVHFAQDIDRYALLEAIKILQKTRLDLQQIQGVNQELILLRGLTQLITQVFKPKK